MMSFSKFLMTLAILASVAYATNAVHCYQCESLTNPKCGEQFVPEDMFKIDCARVPPPRFYFMSNQNATGCMKKSIESMFGHPQIVRTCYYGDVANTKIGCQPDPTLPSAQQLACEVCSGDYCNNSSMLGAIGPMLLVLFFMLTRLFN